MRAPPGSTYTPGDATAPATSTTSVAGAVDGGVAVAAPAPALVAGADPVAAVVDANGSPASVDGAGDRSSHHPPATDDDHRDGDRDQPPGAEPLEPRVGPIAQPTGPRTDGEGPRHRFHVERIAGILDERHDILLLASGSARERAPGTGDVGTRDLTGGVSHSRRSVRAAGDQNNCAVNWRR